MRLRDLVLSFGRVESECNQVKAWHHLYRGLLMQLDVQKNCSQLRIMGSPSLALALQTTQSHVNRVHTHSHTSRFQ